METKENNTPEYYFNTMRDACLEIPDMKKQYVMSVACTANFNTHLKSKGFDFSSCSSKQHILIRLIFNQWVKSLPTVARYTLDISFDPYDNKYDVSVTAIPKTLLDYIPDWH